MNGPVLFCNLKNRLPSILNFNGNLQKCTQTFGYSLFLIKAVAEHRGPKI